MSGHGEKVRLPTSKHGIESRIQWQHDRPLNRRPMKLGMSGIEKNIFDLWWGSHPSLKGDLVRPGPGGDFCKFGQKCLGIYFPTKEQVFHFREGRHAVQTSNPSCQAMQGSSQSSKTLFFDNPGQWAEGCQSIKLA